MRCPYRAARVRRMTLQVTAMQDEWSPRLVRAEQNPAYRPSGFIIDKSGLANSKATSLLRNQQS